MADVNSEGHPLDTVLSIFEEAFDSPESYLKPLASLHKVTLKAIKQIFDFCKKDELRGKRSVASTCPLQELLIENFDDEQIWQEIELQNTPLMGGIKREILYLKENPNKLSLLPGGKHIVSRRPDLEEKEANVGNGHGEFNSAESSDDQVDEDVENGDDDDNDDDDFNYDNDDDDDDDGEHEEEDTNIDNNDSKEFSFSNGANTNRRLSKKKSHVDDAFFKLSDMLDFLDKEDRKYERAYKKDNKRKDKDDEVSSGEDTELVDYFIDMESDDTDEGEDEEWSEAIDATESLVRRKKGKKRKIIKRKTSATKMKYADFFDPPEGEDGDGTNEQHSDADEDEDEEDEEDEEVDAEADIDEDSESDEIPSESEKEEDVKILSNFEEKQERLKQKIEKLEKANLAEKPWQMSGETGGSVRPINSLLEEDVSFDHTTTAAPDITEETTQNLEDIVKQRIKDEAWDDVERKVKPVMEPYEYKKKLPLDQEKSKLSLSQIYEQEYLKQTQAEAEEKEIEEHTEIKALMTKLFVKLDALSNFHFTPKPPKPELKVVSNVPVISVEEVTPVTVSDAMMLAPEEVHGKNKDQKGSSEKTDTDRKRVRRARKRRQHEQAVARGKKAKLMEKLKPGLGNKYSKKAALKKLEKDQTSQKNVSLLRDEDGEKPVKTSCAFFSQLQDEVRDQVKAKKDSKTKKEKSAIKVSQLKL